MLDYNEIRVGKVVVLNDDPYEVLDSHVFRKQQRKPVNATKLKNLITGKVTEYSFHVSEKAAEAEIEARPLTYIYNSKGAWWFHATGDPSERVELPADILGDKTRFLKEKTELHGLYFDDRLIGVRLPIKMTFRVVEAPPTIKGNTAQGGNKLVKLETGASITTPMFVEEGDSIVVNTETGEYVQRVS
ncbi:MAG TPA: elongation factor P [Candidatus Paceibacterota bacterium]|nr:elongation factor P [Candidatus Paceibacterota bacterium]